MTKKLHPRLWSEWLTNYYALNSDPCIHREALLLKVKKTASPCQIDLMWIPLKFPRFTFLPLKMKVYYVYYITYIRSMCTKFSSVLYIWLHSVLNMVNIMVSKEDGLSFWIEHWGDLLFICVSFTALTHLFQYKWDELLRVGA